MIGHGDRLAGKLGRSCDGLYNTVFGVMVYSVGVTGLAAALEELPAATIVAYENVIQKKAYNALILCLGDRVLREITKETTAVGIWKKLETLCMIKSLANRDLAAIDTAISDEDQALLLLTYLPSSYDNFMKTLLYSRDTLKLEDVLATLNFREL
ncbi:hypothetical protein Tco_1005285 [Tanacetum coccineum]|uniref:Retrovirus-related Pol polyprotein from transposon TNT 1-94 n=1 Tax=Tanacetum coccineum TaxID=301880 RepID=A0ABQ5FG61_9ASTR